MEQINSTYQLVELIPKPVFCVKDGSILYANQAARSMHIQIGTEVSKLIPHHFEDYSQFQSGCLFVTVKVGRTICDATITKGAEYDFFTLEDPISNEQLRALSLAGMHLRIPLAGLTASLDTLFTQKATRTFRPYVNQLRKGIHQLHRIINNMSDAAYAGSTAPTEEILDVGKLVDEAIEKSAVFLEEAGVTLQYKGLQSTVYTQANRNVLDRAVFNMLSNAAKFSDPNCPVTVELNQVGEKIQFSVSNHCRSIRPETLAGAFSSYQRRPAVEDSRFGIGLGMPLIKAAAKTHGGTVLIDQPAEGLVRVTLTIGIRQPEESTLLRNSLVRSIDYAGGRDHALLELSDILPSDTYRYESD